MGLLGGDRSLGLGRGLSGDRVAAVLGRRLRGRVAGLGAGLGLAVASARLGALRLVLGMEKKAAMRS
jgi:hypothetical protein